MPNAFLARWIAGAFGALFIGAAPVCAADLYGTLKSVNDTGKLRIGYRDSSPPFSFKGNDGKPVGYSIDLCLKIAGAAQAELKLPKLDIVFVPVTSANRIAKVSSGEVDIECGSTSYTLERRKEVDFSYITFLTGTRLLVKKASGIETYKDLAGRKVAVTKGTTNERRIRDMTRLLGIAMTVVAVDDHDAGFAAVRTGVADAYATDDILLRALIKQSSEGAAFAVVGDYLSYDPYALMLRRDDSAFRLVVDRTLADLFYRREFEKIFDKWFGPMDVPMSDLLRTTLTVQMQVN